MGTRDGAQEKRLSQHPINHLVEEFIMVSRLKVISEKIRNLFRKSAPGFATEFEDTEMQAPQYGMPRIDLKPYVRPLLIIGVVGAAGYGIYKHPPLQSVARGDVGVRINQLTGSVSEFREGSVIVIPGFQEMRIYSLRDQLYRPEGMDSAEGKSPLQSLEGLSLGVDLSVRYALDPNKITSIYKNQPANVGLEVVEPAAQGVIYKIFARYTVREIFSSKRAEIQ
ncbi:MAG TPA: SPFH domain-containing protein, partial [Rhodocyclaceae bacterium]|nr:SPFH domain-containing protein [Rhodocyclaceae bacterium]